jgi:hypothetical protein
MGPEAGGRNPIRAVQERRGHERGSGVGRLHAGRRADASRAVS